MASQPRTWVEVSGRALRYNLHHFQTLLGPRVQIMPVIKANAYGHGADIVWRALRREKVWGFGVAHGDEALALPKDTNVRTIVLSSWKSEQLRDLKRMHTHLVVWDQTSVSNAWRQRVPSNRLHIKLDTGTSRIGFLPSDMPWVLQRFSKKTVGGVFSHFANAEEFDSKNTIQQLLRFTTLQSQLIQNGGVRHVACTAAAIRYPEAYFGLVRLGIGLYGIWPSNEIRAWAASHTPKLHLKPALAWKTRVIQVKTIPAGTAVGYGSTIRVKKPTRIGIIPVGYFDGLDRGLSNTGSVVIRNKRVFIIGRVCMNLTMLNLGAVAAKIGDAVELIGPAVPVEDMATAAQTIPYEILSRIGSHIERHLV